MIWIFGPIENIGEQHVAEWEETFRAHSCRLREHLSIVTWYRFFAVIFALPSRGAVFSASGLLIGHANSLHIGGGGAQRAEYSTEIKSLLRISA